MTEEWSGSAGPELFSPDIQKTITTQGRRKDIEGGAAEKVKRLL